MNFQFAAQGASFQGAMAYYTHDKREPEGERNPTTSERVAWSETRNMLTDRTDTATKIMISTAERSAQLKREAGIRATGRQGTKPVAAFSLAWHPDEAKTLDRDEMTRAADHALKVMGLEKCQAVIIAHRDTAHPHVHVVVNRVSPEDGRMAKIDPNRVRKLDRWANDYEKERGQVYSEKRAEKYERIDERRRKHPDREDRARHIEERRQKRPDAALERQRGPDGRENASRPSEGPQSAAQGLKARSDALKATHRQEWKGLGREFGRSKADIYERWRDPLKEEAARLKVEAKAVWRSHFAEERKHEADRKQMGRSLTGRLSLAITAAREDIRRSDPGTRPGMGRLVFAYLLSGDVREQTFKEYAVEDRAALGSRIERDSAERMAEFKKGRTSELDQAREGYARGREDLSARQYRERAEIRSQWQDIYREKGRDWTPRERLDPKLAPERVSKFDRLDNRETAPRDQGDRVQPEPSRETTERPSKFAWLDDHKQDRGGRSVFERSQEGQEKARDKPKDQERER